LYILFLTLHNLARWVVVGVAVWTLVRAFRGWSGKRAWEKSDDRAGMLFTSMMDTQLLLGLILYFFFSPATPQVAANFSAAMSSPFTRFFGFEHVLMMVLAAVVAHVGRVMARKGKTDLAKHRAAALWFSVTVLIILAAIPWPWMAYYGRPLLRLFGFSI
jgi:hypothetical protein